jgi:GNAT superfamily N-acetyltransferase
LYAADSKQRFDYFRHFQAIYRGKMELKFTSPLCQQPGLIASMLMQSYADLVDSDPKHWGPEIQKWEQFDREIFKHPDTVGSCVFLSWTGDMIIGFGSYDPRRKPEYGFIGHNCVLPGFRARGFGKQQVREILRRFRALDIRAAKTSTLTGKWHIPAQRMYKACGFLEAGRHPWKSDPSLTVIEFEKRLDGE